MSQKSPEIDILERTPADIILRIKHVDISFINSLRRFIYAESPSLAFDTLIMEVNSTTLPDEYISHRIGLLPLRASTIVDFNTPAECSCIEYCSNCSVTFTFNSADSLIESSGSFGLEESRTLTTRQLMLDGSNKNNMNVELAIEEHEEIPICRIKAGQTLKFKAIARLGSGKIHSKFCPAVVASYYIDRDVSINKTVLKDFGPSAIKRFVKACPVRCKNVRGLGTEIESEEENFILQNDKKVKFFKYCEFCHRNAKELDLNQILVVGKNPDEFVFNVESCGSMNAKDIITNSLRKINEECEDLLTAIKEND